MVPLSQSHSHSLANIDYLLKHPIVGENKRMF